MQNPTEENVATTKLMSEQFLDSLHLLKKRFVKAWDMESRSYYRDVFTERYDKIAKDVLNAGNYVYIKTTDNRQQTTVSLKTIYNDRDIYYTTDGSDPDMNSNIYTGPFEIERSCVVKAVCFEDNREKIINEKYILYHKGMGHFKQLNTVAGNYRPEYSGGGEDALLNGAIGSMDYTDGNWHGRHIPTRFLTADKICNRQEFDLHRVCQVFCRIPMTDSSRLAPPDDFLPCILKGYSPSNFATVPG